MFVQVLVYLCEDVIGITPFFAGAVKGGVKVKDKEKTKDQLINELELLRKHITELETSRGERKREKTLETNKDDAIHSDRLAFTGRIAANIAHEIRNPLTNVVLSIQQLKKKIKSENPIVLEYLDMIRKNTERANYLITELLNSARPPKLNMEPYSIHRLLNSALESAETKINAQKIEVIKGFTVNPPKIKLDKEQMGRVFSNIIINGVESMPNGGKLTIITSVSERLFLVKFQDTGKGIPDEDIIKIFDPFFSSKPQGVGLGLTICYGIVVSHRGVIEVESKPKKGTIFRVSLPVE